jgi:hypothetical protein
MREPGVNDDEIPEDRYLYYSILRQEWLVH